MHITGIFVRKACFSFTLGRARDDHADLRILKPIEHLLKESKWVKMESGGGVAKLTLTHLAKDDEGLYTLRMVTKGGDAVHRAYVYVEGKISKLKERAAMHFLFLPNYEEGKHV